MKSLKTLLIAITSAIVIVVAFGSTLLAYAFARDAALKIVVLPSAITAAMMMLAVPVTEASLRSIYVPFNPFGAVTS